MRKENVRKISAVATLALALMVFAPIAPIIAANHVVCPTTTRCPAAGDSPNYETATGPGSVTQWESLGVGLGVCQSVVDDVPTACNTLPGAPGAVGAAFFDTSGWAGTDLSVTVSVNSKMEIISGGAGGYELSLCQDRDGGSLCTNADDTDDLYEGLHSAAVGTDEVVIASACLRQPATGGWAADKVVVFMGARESTNPWGNPPTTNSLDARIGTISVYLAPITGSTSACSGSTQVLFNPVSILPGCVVRRTSTSTSVSPITCNLPCLPGATFAQADSGSNSVTAGRAVSGGVCVGAAASSTAVAGAQDADQHVVTGLTSGHIVCTVTWAAGWTGVAGCT